MALKRFKVQSEQDLRLAVALWMHSRRGDDQEGIAKALEILEPLHHIEWVDELVEELRERHRWGGVGAAGDRDSL